MTVQFLFMPSKRITLNDGGGNWTIWNRASNSATPTRYELSNTVLKKKLKEQKI